MPTRNTDQGRNESQAPTELILLIDSDPATVRMLRTICDARQEHMVTADSALLMTYLETHHVAVILCSEHVEGEQNGLYLLAAVRERYPMIQLVLMSEGIDESLLAFVINEVGVLRYLKKPLVMEQVRKAVEDALRHYQHAKEIDQLRLGYRQMAKAMRGIPYRARRIRRSARLLMQHGRGFVLAFVTALVALQAMFLGAGLIVLAVLYVVKSALGIDIIENLHIQDLLDE